jgi:hypothetical protein
VTLSARYGSSEFARYITKKVIGTLAPIEKIVQNSTDAFERGYSLGEFLPITAFIRGAEVAALIGKCALSSKA